MPQISTLGVTYSTIAAWAAAEVNNDYGVGNPITLLYQTLVNESVAITGPCVRGYIMRPAPGFELNKETLAGVGNLGDVRPNISTPGALALHQNIIISTSAHGSTTDIQYDDCLFDVNFNATSKNVLMRGTIHIGMSRALDASSGNTNAIAENCTVINGTGSFDYVRFHCTNCLSLGSVGTGFVQMAAGSDYNASDDTSAPGANSLDNRTTADLVDYANGDYRTASASALSTAGLAGTYIGFALEAGGGGVSVTVNQIDQAQTIDQITLTQQSVITIGGLYQAQTIDEITLQQGGSLALNNLSMIQTINQVNLTQAHIVSVNDLSQLQAVDQLTLSQAGALSVSDVDQAQTVDQASLTQANIVAVNDTDQVQALDQVTLSTAGTVAINDASQIQTLEQLVLAIAGTVAINNLSQSQLLEQLNLTQSHVVSVDNLSQAQLLQSINFNGVVVGYLQGALTIVSAYNGQIKLTNPLTGEIRIL